jgi:iron complex outermembrane receptor protein
MTDIFKTRLDRVVFTAAAFAAGVVLLLASAPQRLQAQAPDTLRRDTVYEIEPLSVRAVRPTATSGGVSAITVRMDSVRFRPAPLLEHVLRELPLVQVRTNSRGEAQLALRGAEERQIAIILDGVPLTLGWDHRTDLSVIPMTAAQSIRLVRGMSSVLYGPNVLGGVVEIAMGSEPLVTLEPLQGALGVDQTGGYSVGLLSGARLEGDAGELVVRGGVGHRQHDGLAAPADPDALYPALARGDLRVNSDLTHTDGFLNARFAPALGGWISATLSGYDAARGVPPELDTDGPRLWRYPDISRMVTVIAAGVEGVENGLGTAEIDINLGIDRGSTEIQDFALPPSPDDAGLDPVAFFRTVQETEHSDDRTVTLRAHGRQVAGDAILAAAATLADIRHDETITVGLADDAPVATPGTYRQRLWSLGAEVDVPVPFEAGPLVGGRISGGLVWDGAATPDAGPDVSGSGPTMTEWGARVGASASTSHGLLFHTAVSRRGRFPALREMYSSALGRFEPNPALRAEILSAIEGGFTGRFGGYDVQVVGFHQRIDDAIARGAPPEGSSARYMRVNRDRVRSTGLEVIAGYTVGRATLETELTLQSVEVVEAGRAGVRAEYEPEVAGGIGATLPLPAGVHAAAEVQYMGQQFCATPSAGQEEFRQLDPSTRADVQIARTFRLPRSRASLERVGVELAIDNVTDSGAYDQCGLPQPGRTLRLQVRMN